MGSITSFELRFKVRFVIFNRRAAHHHHNAPHTFFFTTFRCSRGGLQCFFFFFYTFLHKHCLPQTCYLPGIIIIFLHTRFVFFFFHKWEFLYLTSTRKLAAFFLLIKNKQNKSVFNLICNERHDLVTTVTLKVYVTRNLTFN